MEQYLTLETVGRIVGPVDAGTLAELIEAGVTPDDLIAAQAWRAAQDPLAGEWPPLPEGRVGLVVEILDVIADDSDPLAGPIERSVSGA